MMTTTSLTRSDDLFLPMGSCVFLGSSKLVRATRQITTPAMVYCTSRLTTGVGPRGNPVLMTKIPKKASTTADTNRKNATFSTIMIRRPSDALKATANATPKESTLTWKTGSSDLA